MRTAETILNIIQDRGKRKLPLDDVYRQLYNPDMYLRAYAKLYRNDGAMTPGTTGETVDGMSLEKIDRVIEAIRFERWTWPPSRRVYISEHSVILTLSAAAVNDAQTPDRRSRYTWHSAALTCGCCWPHTTRPLSA